MKTSKNKRLLTFITLSLISVTAIFTSCSSTNNNSDAPPAHVMVVNTVKGSASQYLFLNNAKVNTTAVAYGQSSGYIAELPGNDNAQFFDSGSNTLNISFAVTLEPNAYYTFYYAGNDTTKRGYATQDNVTRPSPGFASVQFINFSSASAFDFGVTGASKLVTGLAGNNASGYYSVAANASIGIYVAGSLTAALTIPAAVQSEMIYTIYVTGSSAANLSYHVVVHNFSQM